MPPAARLIAVALLLVGPVAAGTLGDTLREAKVPLDAFSAAEIGRPITSYAIATGDPFLLAYYVDDGSGRLAAPLRILGYWRRTKQIRRGELSRVTALSQGATPAGCLGSALSIRESAGVVLLETHLSPSAGCLILLDSQLRLDSAFGGWIVAQLSPLHLLLRASEVHFLPVHPVRLQVLDLVTRSTEDIYPSLRDELRAQYSRLIRDRISPQWCMDHNAQCDPENFDVEITGAVASNERARVFGFRARFDATGFGESVTSRVPPQNVVYLFRHDGAHWRYHEFTDAEFQRRFGTSDLEQFILRTPEAAFPSSASPPAQDR